MYYIHTYLLDVQGSLCLPAKLCFIQANLSELRSCVKVEVDVLGYLSQIVHTVSVDVKQQ